MIYATAQRVRSSPSGEGINVFVFEAATPESVTADGHPDVEALADGSYVGELTLLDQVEEIVAGGNTVTSYLDVALKDEPRSVDVVGTLETIGRNVAAASLPQTWNSSDGSISIRFHAIGRSGEAAHREYVALMSRLIAQLRRAPAVGDPFILQITHDQHGWEIGVNPETMDRLVGLGYQPNRVHVALETSSGQQLSPLQPLVAHLITPVTGAELHDLVRRGGVQVMDGERMVWERRPR